MDQVTSQVLLGVISNALFTLLSAPFAEQSDRPAALGKAIQQAVETFTEVPKIDEGLGGERLRSFLDSPPVAALLRQLFAAEALHRQDLLSDSRALFARLYEAHVVAGVDPTVPARLFDALVGGVGAALAAASAEGLLPAHDALEALRHNVVMDAIASVAGLLELAAGRGLPDLKEVDDFVAAYRRQTAERMGYITPPNFDAVRRVPIDDLYVGPTLLLPRGDQEDPPVRWMLGDLVKRLHRSVVLGTPGGGKSTMARKLCHDIALDRLKGELIPAGTVPILVVLRNYGVAKSSRGLSVRDFIEERAHADFQLDVLEGAIEYLLRAGRAVVVFDGLDELLDTSDRSDVTADIESFATLYPAAAILVTSRRVGYREAPLDPRKFDIATLGQFELAQVEEYAEKWFAITPGDTDQEPEAEASEFLSDSDAVGDLRANPLMLALMCNLYRGAGYIPRNRPEIYEKCAVMLFERWDRGRRINVELDFERHLRPALQHLAHWIYSQADLQSGVSERLLIAEAAGYLGRKRFPDEDDARAEAARFVAFCQGRAWVFTDTGTTPSGERLYEFTHRTFLEFFTAEHLVRTCRTPDRLMGELLPKIERAEWDIVAQLAFQLQDDNLDGAADELLAGLLDAAQGMETSSRRYALLEFASRSLAFLVPEPATLRRVATVTAKQTLADYDAAMGSQGINILAAPAFRALADVNWENRVAVAEAIRDVAVESMTSSSATIASVSEVGLHLDLAAGLSRAPDAYAFWLKAGRATAMLIRGPLCEAAKTDPRFAYDGVFFGLLSPAEVSARHQPSVFFQSRRFELYSSRIRSSIASQLLREASGLRRWLGMLDVAPDVLAQQLAELGMALRASAPPWYATKIAQLGTHYTLEPGPHDALGEVTGDVAIGLLGALGVELEIASQSGEAGETLSVLTSSTMPWQQQLLPLALRRFGSQDVDLAAAIGALCLDEEAKRLAMDWATGEVDYVRWEGSTHQQ
jgi:hypothetical protein